MRSAWLAQMLALQSTEGYAFKLVVLGEGHNTDPLLGQTVRTAKEKKLDPGRFNGQPDSCEFYDFHLAMPGLPDMLLQVI